VAADETALGAFRATNVRLQRQDGFAVVAVSLPQGDVTAAQLEALADIAASFGDGVVRFTGSGQLQLRWVGREDVPALHAALSDAGLARAGAGTAGEVVSCPGSEACRLAVADSRATAREVEARLRARGGAALVTPLSVRASGCPNGCSLHHAAGIGLQGGVRKVNGRPAVHYSVLVGGGVGDSGARFGSQVARIPARWVPDAVERLVDLALAERRSGEPLHDVLARSVDRAALAVADLQELRPEDAREEDFAESAGQAESECAA
jgi:sulfite reductase (NADPH) hemoprotein beta-component